MWARLQVRHGLQVRARRDLRAGLQVRWLS